MARPPSAEMAFEAIRSPVNSVASTLHQLHEAGVLARNAGRIPRRRYAEASTPEDGLPVFEHPDVSRAG